MRMFRLGYVVTLSFLLVLTIVTLTFGFYSAPSGPKSPEYPSYTDIPSASFGTDNNSDAAYRQRQKYEQERKEYEKKQKTFLQDSIVPYARNVFVFWILVLMVMGAAGVVLAKFVSELVGAGFAFSGVWAVLFGPLGGLIWFANSLVRGRATAFFFSPG